MRLCTSYWTQYRKVLSVGEVVGDTVPLHERVAEQNELRSRSLPHNGRIPKPKGVTTVCDHRQIFRLAVHSQHVRYTCQRQNFSAIDHDRTSVTVVTFLPKVQKPSRGHRGVGREILLSQFGEVHELARTKIRRNRQPQVSLE
jgi:hypothetical protein